MPRDTPNAVAFVLDFVRQLRDDFDVAHIPDSATFRVRLPDREQVLVDAGEALLDDFENATGRVHGNPYYECLANRLRFEFYLTLGEQGLLPDVEITDKLLEEENDWIDRRNFDVAFDEDLCSVFAFGLERLSRFLGTVIANQDIDLPDINHDKEAIDALLGFYGEHGHFTSRGASVESLSLLKGTVLVKLLDLESNAREQPIERVKAAIRNEVFGLVRELRIEPFERIRLPQCAKDYVANLKAGRAEQIVDAVRQRDSVDRIDELLAALDPALEKKRTGAWQTLRSDNPDRLSQAANSMVEVLDHALGLLCGTKQLRDVLKDKYGRKEEQWIDATLKWISETKDKLHSVKHHKDYPSEKMTEGLMRSAENVIVIVLEEE